MENRVERPNLSIYSAMATLKDRWGVEMNNDLFLEWADDAARRIGYNIDTLKLMMTVQDDGTVYLPCDAVMVKCVTNKYDVFNTWNAIAVGEDGAVTVDSFGSYSEDFSNDQNVLHGDLVDFKWEGDNEIQVSASLEGESIYVLTEAKITDEEGYPMFSKKQSAAVADYCAYIYTQRNAMAGIKGIDLGYIKALAEKSIAGARVDEYVSDNRLDQMLDAKVSMGRKHYNRNHAFGK